MARYDIENYIDDFIVKLKTVLNNKISEINTEKGDDLLFSVADNAYYFLKTSAMNKADNAFIFYEPFETVTFDDEQSLKGLGYNAKTYRFELGIGFRNNSRYSESDINNFKRVVRYQKVLEECIVAVNHKLRGYCTMRVFEINSNSIEKEETSIFVSSFLVEVTLGG